MTTELTGVIRPLIAETEGGTQVIGQALVVGPVATSLLEQSGTAVVILGGDLANNDNAVLASTGGTVQGVGRLVIDAGGLLSLADATDTGEALDLNNLLAGLDNNGSPLDALDSVLGADNGNLLSSVTDTVEGLTGGLSGTDGGLLSPVTDAVGGLTGGLAGTDGGLLSPVTDVVDGLTSGGLTGTDVGLIDPLLDTVDGLTGGLLGGDGGLLDPVTGTTDGLQSGDGDLLGSATDILGGLTGTGLPSSETIANEGLVDTLDNTLLDPLVGGLL
ncbi:collagen-like triple helix repeat-containing protein [Marinobacterium aestuarii]|uniref:collagen-like triple helix repeat-containing protein n=1 Tax=Marinobacterium aestuarii TaxID=1821621 RepID=UPI002029FB50|nr:collagen-like triple helix repeat-containing protein [Marinobacterium aestuarii]